MAHAAAAARGVPLWRYLAGDGPISLPMPEIQIFGGGAHAGRRIDIQDLMVLPVGATTFAQALDMTAEVYRAAGELMRDAGSLAGVADEGGWWPSFATNEDALAALVRAIERAGYIPGDEVAIALDIAASEFGRDGRYRLGLERRELDRNGMIELLLRWLDRYPIASIEDPLAEDDRDGWIAFAQGGGRARRDRRRRLPDDKRRARPRSRDGSRLQRRAHQAEPGGNSQRDEGRASRRTRRGIRDDRLRTLGRDRRHLDRPSRGRLECRAAQGRIVRALRTHGKMERGAADRGSAGAPPLPSGTKSPNPSSHNPRPKEAPHGRASTSTARCASSRPNPIRLSCGSCASSSRLTGTKYGCGVAQCGACTVHIDGVATRSCVLPVSTVSASAKIVTIEGLSPDGSHPVQKAWVALDVPQCGFCQSGMIMAAAALLRDTPKPTDAEIDEAMTNICRCGTYNRVRAAIKAAAQGGNAKQAGLAIQHVDGSTS